MVFLKLFEKHLGTSMDLLVQARQSWVQFYRTSNLTFKILCSFDNYILSPKCPKASNLLQVYSLLKATEQKGLIPLKQLVAQP